MSTGLASSRKQSQRIGFENRLLVRVAERQRQELVDVEPHVFHARARPVGAPEDPIRELRETRKVLQQPGGRYPGDVEPHRPVASQNEKCLLHVQRPTAVRHHDAEIGKIDRHVVEVHRVAVLGAGPGENAGAGVDHHRQPALLAPPIDLPQGVEAVRVRVRRHPLVRWMNLDEPSAELGEAVHVARRVLREARMHAAVRQQSRWIGLGVCRGEGVARIGESHHVGRGVIHEAHPPHARAVHDLEQRARIVHHLDHQVPMRVLTAPHRLEHLRLELAPRLDVDVNVRDACQCLAGCQPGVIHGAQKVPWDRSGFNYALVRTPSGRNTGSCAAATVRAARPDEPRSHVAIGDVARAQQGGAELAPTPQESRTLDYTRSLPMSIDLTDGGTRRIRQTAGLTVLGCVLFLASCDERPLSSPAPAGGVDVQSVIGGPFTFENFPLGATPGTVCPGSSACTNGAAEPAIRADATGTFYVSSELGLGGGTYAWKSTDGGLHYTTLESPNQISQAFGGLAPGGGDTDVGVAPQANASGVHNVYVAGLSLANVTVSTSQDGGTSWSKDVLSATIPGDDREWIAADQATKVCVSYHDIATFNIDVNCSFDAGANFTQLGTAIDAPHAFLLQENSTGNLVIDPNSHVMYQVFSGIANATEAVLPANFHAVWIAISRDGGQTFTDKPVYVNPNTSVSYGHQFVRS